MARLRFAAKRQGAFNNMQFNVAQLLKEPAGGTRDYVLDEDLSGLDGELMVRAPLTGDVHFTRTPAGILVQGRIHTEVLLSCSRCSEPLRAPLDVILEEEFRPSIEVTSGRWILPEPDDEEDDVALRIDDHHILSLQEVVRQTLLLAVPVQPLCRPDCAGLCPHCGANLNEGSCSCPAPEPDPRWAVLKSLLQE